MVNDSQIVMSDTSTTFVGSDAVRAYQAIVIASGLRLYANCGMKPSRAWTPTAMLAAASKITGQTYKRRDYLKAADDLQTWADTMKAALPIIDNTGKTK